MTCGYKNIPLIIGEIIILSPSCPLNHPENSRFTWTISRTTLTCVATYCRRFCRNGSFVFPRDGGSRTGEDGEVTFISLFKEEGDVAGRDKVKRGTRNLIWSNSFTFITGGRGTTAPSGVVRQHGRRSTSRERATTSTTPASRRQSVRDAAVESEWQLQPGLIWIPDWIIHRIWIIEGILSVTGSASGWD